MSVSGATGWQNQNLSVLSLTAASTSGSTADNINSTVRGIILVVDVTSITGTTPSVVVTVQGKDETSGKYYTLLASAALTAAGTTVLTVYPGVAAVANSSANLPLPRVWRVIYTVAGTAPAVTATVGANLII